MGSVNCSKNNPAEVLTDAIAGGVTLFQFREKGEGALLGAEKICTCKKIASICQEHQIPFIVNDDIELALSIDADGVHIGQEDESVKELGTDWQQDFRGFRTYHGGGKAAIAGGADYFGIGPIFPTKTKPDAKASQGTN